MGCIIHEASSRKQRQRMIIHTSVPIIRSHSSGERHPVMLTAFISTYIISTIILYNNFFGLQLSSRWPLLATTYLLGPLAVWHVLFSRRIYVSFWPSLALFVGCYFLLEVLHAALGSPEAIGIVSLASILVFLALTSRFSKAQCIAALMASCVLYLLFIYPLALFHGMVGNSISDTGVFIPQYIPSLGHFTLNGNFQSGRGVIGMVGAVIAIGSIIRIRSGLLYATYLPLLAVGVSALLVSDARGPILSFFLVLAALIIPISNRARVRLLFILPAGIVLLQGLSYVFINVNIDFAFNLGILSRQDMDTSDLARAAAWNEGLRMITASSQSGIFGYGAIGSAEAMQQAFGQYHPDIEQLMSAHNLLLQILLDGGVALMLAFVFYMARIASYGLKYAEYIPLQDIDAPALLSFVLLSGISGSILSVDRINESMYLLVLICAAIDKQMQIGRHQFRSIALPTYARWSASDSLPSAFKA